VRIGIEEKNKDIYKIFQILNLHIEEDINLDNILIELVSKDVSSSDVLFLVLQKLRRDEFLDGSKGTLRILKEVTEKEMKSISSEVDNEIGKNIRLFVTPLEIGKFYMCQRRVFLEKIALSRQFKEAVGKTWDGEVIHFAINLFVKNLTKKDPGELIEESAKDAIEKYKDKTTLTEERVKEFISRFNDLIKEENFSHIFTEKTFETFRDGLTGTPDLVCMKENGEIIPVDIKLGKLNRRGVKEEHLLQIVGEVILVEDFFRKEVNSSCILYFESNSLVKIDIDRDMKRKFSGIKSRIERICKTGYIPEMSHLDNFRKRVCLGCHVKPACDNIEVLKRIRY
jgi:CRISPR/Cas system-associated exonuclease Cas4 (RecB family)